jgi:hypothetical protein
VRGVESGLTDGGEFGVGQKGNLGCWRWRADTRQRLIDGYGLTDGPPVADAGA